jgi:uroporphyrinogen decarboxylase
MRQYVGSDGIVGAWVPYGPFNTASLLIDHEELYSLFLTDPEYFDKLLSFCVTRFEDYVRAFQQSGLDVYFVGGNVPGGFMGRKNYETYALPYEKRFIDLCQSDGKPCIYHNCGSIMPLIESYKLLGSRVVEPFSPKPLGDADLPRAVETIGNAYVMICGVDQVNIIQKGTEKDVVEATERTAKALLGHDNCILQNADFFEYGTPLENIRAFVDTAKRCAAT